MEFSEDDVPKWDPTDRPEAEDDWADETFFLFDPGTGHDGTQSYEMSDRKRTPSPDQTMRDLLRRGTDADPADLCRQLAGLADDTELLDPIVARNARINALAIALKNEGIVDPGLATGLLGQFESGIDASIASNGTAAKYQYTEAQRTVDIFSTLIERAPTIDAAKDIERKALQFFVSPPMERAYERWIVGLRPAMEFRRNVEVIGFTPSIEQIRRGDCYTQCKGMFFGNDEQDAMFAAIEDYCTRNPDDRDTFERVKDDPDTIHDLHDYNDGAIGSDLVNKLRLWMSSQQLQDKGDFTYRWDVPNILQPASTFYRAQFSVRRNDDGYQFVAVDADTGKALADFAYTAERPIVYDGPTRIALELTPSMRDPDTRVKINYDGDPYDIPVAKADLPIFMRLEEIGRALGHDTLAQHAKASMADASVAENTLSLAAVSTNDFRDDSHYYCFSYGQAAKIQDAGDATNQSPAFSTLNTARVLLHIQSIDNPHISDDQTAAGNPITVVQKTYKTRQDLPYPNNATVEVSFGDENTESAQAAEFALRARAYVDAINYLVEKRYF